MPPNITGFGPSLLKLAIALSVAAYEDDFSKFGGEILYHNPTSKFEIPVFYVYKLNGALWIINRGSIEPSDMLTCAAFDEYQTDFGNFHEGFYKAAKYTYDIVKPYIQNWKEGPIYFAGHSYGASVAPIVYVLFQRDFPEKDGGAFAFGPVPMMSLDVSKKYFNKIVTIVNHLDLVPTLSVENLYERLKFFVPLIKEVDAKELVAKMEEILDYFQKGTGFFDNITYQGIKTIIPEVVDAVIGYCQGGEIRTIRWPPGVTYQIHKSDPKPLAETEVDATTQFTALSIYPFAMTEHPDKRYLEVVDTIPDE